MAEDKSRDADLERIKKGIISHFLAAVRSTPLGMSLGADPMMKLGVNETLKDTTRDLALAYEFIRSRGDKQSANSVADSVEMAWSRYISKNNGTGQGEFRMAIGWKLPENIKYNGKIDKEKEGKSITSPSAVFLRHKTGEMEVLDHKDPRYKDLVMPYIAGQLAIPVGVGKAMAAIRAIPQSGVVIEALSKIFDYAGKGGALGNTAGGIGYVVSSAVDTLVLKPAAIQKISCLFSSPEKMQPSALRVELNAIFEQYSYLNGPMAERYFVPQIKANESPLQRLQDLAIGHVHGVFESENPFDRITDLSQSSKNYRSTVNLTNIRKSISENLDFQRGFLALAQKTLGNDKLSDHEVLLIKFGMNVYTGMTAKILPEKGDAFSISEKDKVIKDLRNVLLATFLMDENASLDDIKSRVSAELRDIEIKARESQNHGARSPMIQSRMDNPFSFN